jgi:A/G-specific adenine glycosylase
MVTRPAMSRNFQGDLLSWFDTHARDLPWRRSADPYRIWISEIMLQQTRVNAVLDHYARFLSRFPSVHELAEATEADVLTVWSGLGYYRRARMMHKTAQVLVAERNGVFPRTAAELKTLPGIGEYTSSAIASIAFGEPVAVVDGNVERVLLRVFPDEARPVAVSAQAKGLRGRALSLLDPQRPGDFNQAMMELGAMVCLPQRPLCLHCPVQSFCATRGEHPATPRKKMQIREIAYALSRRTRSGAPQVLLEQRLASASLMPGMWELPEVMMPPGDQARVETTLRHAITVTNYRVRVVNFSEAELKPAIAARESFRKWIKVSELGSLPLTGLARKALQKLQILPVTH